MLKKLAKTILATTSILTGAALSTASPSQAVSFSVELKSYTPEIKKVGVNSTGTAYEMKGLMDIAAEVQLVVDGGVVAHVKNWKTWLVIRKENSSWVHFSDDGVSESYPIFQRPQKVDVLLPLAVPHMTLAPVMVSYCNALADDLRDQGKSNTEIFSQDRTIPVAIRADQSEEFVPGYHPLHQAYSDTGDISGYNKINLICKGRAPTPPVQTAGAFKPPPVDFKVQDIDLFLTTFSGANTQPNAATTCKKGQIKVRLKASKAGNAKFKLWTKVGAGPMTSKVIDAWASFDGNGGYKAEYVEWVSVDKTTFMQAKAEEMVSDLGKSTSWEDISLPCKDVGGGGLATNPNTSNPDQPVLPPAKYDGKLTIADSVLVKSDRCPRQGQVVFQINSNNSSPVSYSLVGTNGQSWTGTVQMLSKGNGKYQGTGVKPFNVLKTEKVTFVLKRIKDNKAYVLDFRARQFICKKPFVNTGSGNLKPDSNQPASSTRVPASLVDKTKSDAVKRRLEAAKKKKAAIAKRKASAAKALKLKAAKDTAKKAAIAKRKRDAAKKKAALAVAKKKRDAALKARQLKIQQAAIKRAAAVALARRKAALQKSAVPSNIGTATQRRVIRRR